MLDSLAALRCQCGHTYVDHVETVPRMRCRQCGCGFFIQPRNLRGVRKRYASSSHAKGKRNVGKMAEFDIFGHGDNGD